MKQFTPTVSAYRQWVHSIYLYRPGTPEAREHGKQVEKDVTKLARPPANPDWELIYQKWRLVLHP